MEVTSGGSINGCQVLCVFGSLSGQDALGVPKMASLAHPSHPTILDLDGVTFIDSLGILALTRAAQAFQLVGLKLCLARVPRLVMEPLLIVHLPEVMTIEKSVEEAAAAIGEVGQG